MIDFSVLRCGSWTFLNIDSPTNITVDITNNKQVNNRLSNIV